MSSCSNIGLCIQAEQKGRRNSKISSHFLIKPNAELRFTRRARARLDEYNLYNCKQTNTLGLLQHPI